MVTSLSEDAGLEGLIRDRATRLFTYLKELTALRSDVKRNCDEYEQVIWWGEIPREKECYCAAWDLGRESAYEDWIRIERPHRKAPPNPPPTLAPWLNRRDLADSSLDAPPLRESIVEELSMGSSGDQVERQTVIRRLEDYPAITRQWELYVENVWWPWALEDRRLETIQSVYNQLFAAYQMQDRLGEAYEVVVGAGLLTWKPPHGPNVRRHVVVSQATVEFDSKTAVISVAPAAAGARLALEQDMLEPQDRPLPEVQNQIQQQLSGIGDEIWSGPELVNSLNAYFHQLTPENALSLTLEPSDGAGDPTRPHMTLAPALIVRKRTEGNLVRIFDEIANQLRSGGLVPPGVEKLVSISDDTGSGDGGDALEGDSAPEELYFPLLANEAQLQIARKLQGRHGVLVQGPPGTGKSHTITNLICHLLATGQKLLVTSHTARALRVLKNYFPAEVSPLCVFLMGDDTAALRELEESNQGILNCLNTWDTGTSRAQIRKLQSGLDHSRRELAEAYTSLKQIRTGETQSVDLGYGGYRGSPQALAERLGKETAEFEWVTGAGHFDGPPPLINGEALELLSLAREFGSSADNDVPVLPELVSLLEPQLFNDLVLKEKEFVARIESVDGQDRPILGSLAYLDRATREGLAAALRDLCTALDSFALRLEAWIGAAVRDVVLGKHHTWEQLPSITTSKVNAVGSRVTKVSEMKLSGLEQRDLANVRAAPQTLVHLRNVMSKMLGTAVLWGWIEDNPTKGVTLPRMERRRVPRVLTLEEIGKLAEALRSPPGRFSSWVSLRAFASVSCWD
ncbi:MAG: AAA domain-containing protein [Terriglobia bacterium]